MCTVTFRRAIKSSMMDWRLMLLLRSNRKINRFRPNHCGTWAMYVASIL